MAKEILEIEVKSNIGQAAKDTDKLGVSANKASGGFTKMGGAVKGFGMILRTAGIGAIIALIAKFIQTLSKNQKVIDFFSTSMHFLTDIFSQLGNQLLELGGKVGEYFKSIFEDPVGSLKKFGKAIVDNILERIRSFLDMIGHLSSAVQNLVKGNFAEAGRAAKEAGKEFVDMITGVDNSYEKLAMNLKDVHGTIEQMRQDALKAIEVAKGITELEKRAGRAEIALQKTMLQSQKNAEIQRQIRDDETRSFEERIDANKKLNDILIAQIIEEKRVQQIIVEKAQALYDQNQNEEKFLALEQAKIGLLEIEERITGQLSEQKTNQVALTKEQQEAENELRLAVLDGLDLELEDLKVQYEEKIKLAKKSGIDTTEITKKYEKDKANITEEFNKEQNEALSELRNDNLLAEEEDETKRQLMLLDIQKQAELDKLAEHENFAELKLAIDEKYAGKVRKIEKKSAEDQKKFDKSVKDAKIKLAGQGLQIIEEVAGEGSKIAKGAAIAQATISGVEAVQNAFTTAQKSPITVAFPAYPFLQAGAAATFSALQLRKIIAGSPPSESGGGGGAGGVDTQAPAPQMLSGSFSLGQGQAPEPVKAFVVTDEMTNSQNQLANIRRRSTI